MEAFHLQPNHQRVPEAHLQDLGFDLTLLPRLSWVPGHTSFIYHVGYALILDNEVPSYGDQIPSLGLKVFPNPVTVLKYTLCQIQIPIKDALKTFRSF